MIGLDVVELVQIVHHHPRRLAQAVLRGISQPVQPLDPRAVGQMEMGHPVVGDAPFAFLLGQIAGA